MFGRSRIVELEQQLATANDLARQLAEQMRNLVGSPILIDIRRDARMNKFTFLRNGEMHTIETMGLISDDIRDWKRKLLE